MRARRHKQFTRSGEHEYEDEKENISFSSSFSGTTTTQEKGGGDDGFRRAGANGLQIRGHRNESPPRSKAPSADAQAGVVQAAEEWATTVDDPAAWSDVAPAYSTEVAQYNNQPMGARGYIPLIEAPAVSLVHDETLA